MNPPSLNLNEINLHEKTAEAGGFEPPVRLPVRQFSKLLVSATHPNFHTGSWYCLTEAPFLNCECKGKCFFSFHQTFQRIFFHLSIKKFPADKRQFPNRLCISAIRRLHNSHALPRLKRSLVYRQKKPCFDSKEALFAEQTRLL